MRFGKSLLVLAALAGSLMAQDRTDARDALNRGVTAFKTGNYPVAVEAFQKAVDLDPSFLTARLYLATAYMQQYVPGQESAQNRAVAEAAVREFNRVLEQDPSNVVAVQSVASLNLNMKQWDEAQRWYEKLAVMSPSSSDANYSMGFIAWSKWYPAYADARRQLGMRPEDPGPLPAGSLKADLRARYSQVVDQGIQSLEKALAINPQYSDAMAYMNLLIRERADLADSKAEYTGQVAIADDWVHRALAAKQQKAETTPPILPQRIRVGGNVQMAKLATKVDPVGATATGEVVLNIVIGKDGHVNDIKVQGGPPVLIAPALNAVKQWVYHPTLLNGQPVEVATSVTLTFP
jgi:tetratricopeptide (TPR) repeat protein